MAVLPTPNTDYSDRDFASLRARLISLAESAFPAWTDHDVPDFGNVLLEMFAWIGDVLNYYMDASAREAFLMTATQRQSVLNLCRLIGYTPTGASAATVSATLSIAAATAGDVVFPAGTVCKTANVVDELSFQTLASATITAGNTSVATDVENSTSETDAFTSDGTPNQDFTLTATPYLDDSATVTAGPGGGAWTEVDNFLDSTASDKHFTTLVDQNDRCKVRFGNGVNGIIPTGTITIAYKTGGGVAGNIEAAALTRVDGTFTDSLGNPVTVSCTNALAATGGADRETISHIQSVAPASLRSLTRSVARDDYEAHALEVAGVARVLAMSSNEDAGVPEGDVYVYVVPTGGGTPSGTLKTAVATALNTTKPKTITVGIDVIDPLYLTVNVAAKIWIRQGYVPATVAASVRAALADWFALLNDNGEINANVDFGFNYKDEDGEPAGEIAMSDIFNVVRDVEGVRKVGAADADFTLNTAHADLAIANNQFPILGTVTLIDGSTGGAL